MQLTNTTDYAIRIVCYLAIKKHRVTTAKLASELKIPESYIPKITKQLKKEKRGNFQFIHFEVSPNTLLQINSHPTLNQYI